MITLIAAVNKNISTGKLGIGKDNKIPWHLPEDLQFFKQQTYGNIVVMGRKTYESIGSTILRGRDNIVLSNTLYNKMQKVMIDIDGLLFNHYNGEFIVSKCELDVLVRKLKVLSSSRKKEVFIIGGQEIYTQFMKYADRIILTEVYGKYQCDTFFPSIPHTFEITSYSQKKTSKTGINYRHLYFNKNNHTEKNAEINYKDLVLKILNYGNHRSDRTGTGTISLFGEQLRFDISKSIPLLTSKRVPWKTCIRELLWMLRGETDAKILQQQGVHIWDGNSSREFLDNRGLTDYPEGELGPVYGWQIRRSGANYPNKEGGVDQLAYIENLLKTDPFSRRILWNLWNPSDLDKMALHPCFPPGTLVLTNNGYKNIEDVVLTDKLLTHKGNWKSISSIQQRDYEDEIYEFYLQYNSKRIRSTKNHPFLVKDIIRDSRSKAIIGYSDEAYWCEAKDITKQHVMCLPVNKNSIIPSFNIKKHVNQYYYDTIHKTIEDENEWFMLGYFMGDGWRDQREGRNTFLFVINNEQQYVYEKLTSFLHLYEKKSNRTNKVNVYTCSNKIWWVILKDFGYLAHNKRVPEWVQDAPKQYIEWFIEGYVAADGCKTEKNAGSFTTVSPHLAYGLQRLYAKLGKVLSVSYQVRPKTKIIEGRLINQRNTYHMVLSKKNSGKKYVSNIDEDYLYFDVRGIKKTVEDTKVFNFDVEDDHSYTVQNVSVHNCHMGFQLYCEEIGGIKYLSGMLTQRSSDIMIGNPLNYLFYTILIYILALKCDMKPKELVHSSGDVHVYKNIIDETYEYLSRQNRSLPVLELNPEIKDKTWEEIVVEDFDIIGYYPDTTIKMQMAV